MKWDENIIILQKRGTSLSTEWIAPKIEAVEIADCKGRISKLAVGVPIYSKAKIKQSLIFWTYYRKEYLKYEVSALINPNNLQYLTRARNNDPGLTPICLASDGNSDQTIYKEEFERAWLHLESYTHMIEKMSITKGLCFFILFFSGVKYIHSISSGANEKTEFIKRIAVKNESLIQDEIKSLKAEFYASDAEIEDILSDVYVTCSHYSTKTKQCAVVLKSPHSTTTAFSEIQEGEWVMVLLYCLEQDYYKVKYNDLTGWVHKSVLEVPKFQDYSLSVSIPSSP